MYYICNMKKEKIVTIRISEEEYDILIKEASSIGLTLSAYMRMCALLKHKTDAFQK